MMQNMEKLDHDLVFKAVATCYINAQQRRIIWLQMVKIVVISTELYFFKWPAKYGMFNYKDRYTKNIPTPPPPFEIQNVTMIQ